MSKYISCVIVCLLARLLLLLSMWIYRPLSSETSRTMHWVIIWQPAQNQKACGNFSRTCTITKVAICPPLVSGIRGDITAMFMSSNWTIPASPGPARKSVTPMVWDVVFIDLQNTVPVVSRIRSPLTSAFWLSLRLETGSL